MASSPAVEPEPKLPLDDYRRYGRQMILDGFGLDGQLKLMRASVLVVGAGGLGCPALQYLAAAGVGTLGIIDHDTVEVSNLQRQILHTESRVGMPKVLSAAEAIKQINSRVKVNPIAISLSATNAVELVAPYDLILDCTDNLPTRYLLSDTAVRHLPLKQPADVAPGVAATSVERGPCFRCLFPKPPAPELAGSCEELGVLGAVTGVVGNLQALEAIKIITEMHDGKPSLLMFSALAMPPFRSVKLRARRASCPACGVEGEKVGSIEDTDYVAFCRGARPDWVSRGMIDGSPNNRIRAKEMKAALHDESRKPRILDVRPRTEFGICHLPGSRNIPIKELLANPASASTESGVDGDLYVVCRLGNDSQLAVEALRAAGWGGVVKDLVGGLRAWAREVDNSFPIY